MSDAALCYVRGCTHPKVKDGTRDLFEAVASFVPDGETTTPAIGMPALARQARRSLRTVVKRLPDLVEIGEVKVLDGGVGKVARYQIVHLEGAPPIAAAPLPLRADLQAVARRARPQPTLPDDTTGDLFTDRPTTPYEHTAKNLCRSFIGWVIQPVQIVHRLAAYLCRSFTGWVIQPVQIVHRLAAYLCRSFTGWRSAGEEPVQIVHRLPIESDTDLVSARDVLLLKETTTTTAPAAAIGPRPAKPPPCRWLGTTHAYCDGRVHVPMAFHREERRKLARSPGETDADLDARLFARYSEILAAIPDTEAIPDRNDFAFWNRMLRSAPVSEAPSTRARSPRRAEGVTGSRCPHDPICTWEPDCIARCLAEGAAERAQKAAGQ